MSRFDSRATAAVNRFGLGARAGELAGVGDPVACLLRQIAAGAPVGDAFADLSDSVEYLRRVVYRRQRMRLRQADRRAPTTRAKNAAETMATMALPSELRAARKAMRAALQNEVAARFRVATRTATPFSERLVHFWSNHFAVSLDKGAARPFALPMEREAIRPHITGRFIELLLAVETHPAMLFYLDNAQSIGPESRLGARVARRLARKGDAAKGKAGGLNENLGREIMELHTLGVDGGYTQADVTELARAITGWGVPGRREFSAHGSDAAPQSAFVFRAAAHQPGTRVVLGKRYAAGGVEQGRAILADLARHPATARHLATQLARHFVADDPPAALVARMAQAYLDHDTRLDAVYRCLIASPEAWATTARKFKTPQDFLLSALRAGAIDSGRKVQPLLALLARMGEPLLTPRSPAGFADVAADWLDG
ncbi:MAG TPA: DUF1800 domain-containing protein, partial [Rhodanobacteraceae bacterium]|nr:DUF1800 domain-containing protein [Rhodanobacteraceae bacterium]